MTETPSRASKASGVKIASSFGPGLCQIDGKDLGLRSKSRLRIFIYGHMVSVLFPQFFHQKMILRVATVVKVAQFGHAG